MLQKCIHVTLQKGVQEDAEDPDAGGAAEADAAEPEEPPTLPAPQATEDSAAVFQPKEKFPAAL